MFQWRPREDGGNRIFETIYVEKFKQSKRNFAYVPGHQTSQAGIFQIFGPMMKQESPMNT